jgi:hypothetical protein
MSRELEKGFVLRSVRLRLLKTLIPGLAYSRTNVIAQTFDNVFFDGKTLQDLPDEPRLCINTTVMNNGQVGKFSQLGFSTGGLHMPGANPAHQVPMPDFPIALAVAASAAFPVGLPPLVLARKRFPQNLEFRGSLTGARSIVLTDGGVLENLGIQTLLKSDRFSTWNMIVSDAGTTTKMWVPGSIRNSIRSFGVWVLSGRTLDQIMLIMNDKQNRWARQQVIEQIGLRTTLKRRNVLFVRVAQDWDRFLLGIPSYRLQELAEKAKCPLPPKHDAAAVGRLLEQSGIDLGAAREHYKRLGGKPGADEVNAVSTNFTRLAANVLDKLAAHAAWQIHATHAVYGL